MVHETLYYTFYYITAQYTPGTKWDLAFMRLAVIQGNMGATLKYTWYTELASLLLCI